MESSEENLEIAKHRVLLTGASGFIGSHVLRDLSERAGFEVHPLSRYKRGREWLQADICNEDEIDALELSGYSEIVHCAGRAHIMRESDANPLQSYRDVNVVPTARLARKAAESGVKRFIFISSVKVNGESTVARGAFKETDKPAPEDAYSVSKMEAESVLLSIARETGLEVVIVRPVLVYGAGVKGNFRTLMKLASSRLPLPVAAFKNKRSLVGVDNVADFIGVCIEHPGAANEVFLVSDGRDLSVSQLLCELSRAAGRPSFQFPFPLRLLEVTAQLFGKRAMFRRVAGSLEVDSSKARELLHWQAPVSLSDGLKRCFKDME
ncbi:NAD-dependent epimerase/dehydratase family protein [Marinobacter sp. MMG032]|uniref:NAD-dependent epimerase/dehydratase family protein n=1 Tax=Marinobacter sp. MMG032 TaxID=3158548 RepID=A0AAU7MNY4_9GAMM